MNNIDLFIETGEKKTFAGAIAWPGWCRHGRDEKSALQALFDYGPRYAHIIKTSGIPFTPLSNPADFIIVARNPGDGTTDFGAPSIPLSTDKEPLTTEEFEKQKALLQACWQAFDATAAHAQGKTLRKGPRGGGRDLEKMTDHVIGADRTYLGQIAWKHKIDSNHTQAEQLAAIRQAILEALEAGFKGELPDKRPRGGEVWPLRYYIRRSAWHVVDHIWEIEDRME